MISDIYMFCKYIFRKYEVDDDDDELFCGMVD